MPLKSRRRLTMSVTCSSSELGEEPSELSGDGILGRTLRGATSRGVTVAKRNISHERYK